MVHPAFNTPSSSSRGSTRSGRFYTPANLLNTARSGYNYLNSQQGRHALRLASSAAQSAHSVYQSVRGPRARSSVGGQIRSGGSYGVRNAAATKVRNVKKNKSVPKLSPKFVKKVKKALESKMIKGTYETTSLGSVNPLYNGRQTPYNLSLGTSTLMFDPLRVLAYASTLWNKKAAVEAPTLTGCFSNANAKIHVINSYCKYHFKNNLRRTVELDIYDCMYKNNVAETLGHYPAQYWDACITDDITNGVTVSGCNGYLGVGATNATQWGATPGTTSDFSKFFKYTLRKIVLEPGQTFTHSVQGPKYTDYDYAKFWDTTVFQNCQKGLSQALMVVVRQDLVGTIANSVGRMSSVVSAAPNGGNLVCVEREDHYVLGMPEQVGFEYPVATTAGIAQPLHFRRHVYCQNNWVQGTEPTGAASIIRIDEMDPDVPETMNP